MSRATDKVLHDLLLVQKPEGVDHPADCPLCVAEEDLVKTYTEEEFAAETAKAIDAAVASATAGLRSELDTLKAGQAEAATAEQIAAAKAEAAATVTDLQAKLDAAVADATAKGNELDALKTAQATEAAEAAAKAEADKVRDERSAEVTATAVFPDEYVADNAERWAGMSAEAFTAQLDEYKAIAAKHGVKPPAANAPPAARSALTAAAEGDEAKPSALRAVMDLRKQGVDVRSA